MPSGADIIKDYITEFSRLQNWMISIKDKDPITYSSMHDRYIDKFGCKSCRTGQDQRVELNSSK